MLEGSLASVSGSPTSRVFCSSSHRATVGSILGSMFSCGRLTVSEMAWAKIAKTLMKIIKLRRLWAHLGVHLQRFANLRELRDKKS